MLVLGLETSGERGNAALVRGQELVAEHWFPHGFRHARNIMAAVDEVLRRAGVDKHTVDAVAVTEGPGSFTGLRVGVTCAKTLAWLLGWRAVGVPTLEVLAQNVRPEQHLDAVGNPCRTVCPLLDARRSFVYGQVFEWCGGRWCDRTGLLAGAPLSVADSIPPGTLIFGSGVHAYPDVFLGLEGGRRGLRAGPDDLAVGRAEHTARLGLRALRAGQDVDPMTLVAKYYRRTEAEEKLAGRER